MPNPTEKKESVELPKVKLCKIIAPIVTENKNPDIIAINGIIDYLNTLPAKKLSFYEVDNDYIKLKKDYDEAIKIYQNPENKQKKREALQNALNFKIQIAKYERLMRDAINRNNYVAQLSDSNEIKQKLENLKSNEKVKEALVAVNEFQQGYQKFAHLTGSELVIAAKLIDGLIAGIDNSKTNINEIIDKREELIKIKKDIANCMQQHLNVYNANIENYKIAEKTDGNNQNNGTKDEIKNEETEEFVEVSQEELMKRNNDILFPIRKKVSQALGKKELEVDMMADMSLELPVPNLDADDKPIKKQGTIKNFFENYIKEYNQQNGNEKKVSNKNDGNADEESNKKEENAAGYGWVLQAPKNLFYGVINLAVNLPSNVLGGAFQGCQNILKSSGNFLGEVYSYCTESLKNTTSRIKQISFVNTGKDQITTEDLIAQAENIHNLIYGETEPFNEEMAKDFIEKFDVELHPEKKKVKDQVIETDNKGIENSIRGEEVNSLMAEFETDPIETQNKNDGMVSSNLSEKNNQNNEPRNGKDEIKIDENKNGKQENNPKNVSLNKSAKEIYEFDMNSSASTVKRKFRILEKLQDSNEAVPNMNKKFLLSEINMSGYLARLEPKANGVVEKNDAQDTKSNESQKLEEEKADLLKELITKNENYWKLLGSNGNLPKEIALIIKGNSLECMQNFASARLDEIGWFRKNITREFYELVKESGRLSKPAFDTACKLFQTKLNNKKEQYRQKLREKYFLSKINIKEYLAESKTFYKKAPAENSDHVNKIKGLITEFEAGWKQQGVKFFNNDTPKGVSEIFKKLNSNCKVDEIKTYAKDRLETSSLFRKKITTEFYQLIASYENTKAWEMACDAFRAKWINVLTPKTAKNAQNSNLVAHPNPKA